MSRKKGNRIQRKAIAHLIEEGWEVSKVERGGKFVKQKDCFGLFDLVAIKEGKDKGEIALVQVTCNTPHTHKNYRAFAQGYSADNIHILQWVWYDYYGWKKFRYVNQEKYECYEDYRD